MTTDTILGLHFLNALLIIGLPLLLILWILLRRRQGADIGRFERITVYVAEFVVVAQMFMGILLLADHRRQDIWHYIYGIITLLLVVAATWLVWQQNRRHTLMLIMTLSLAAIVASLTLSY